MYDVLHWATLIVLWATIGINMFDVHRRHRKRGLINMSKKDVAKTTGLTVLQVDVAMDAAMTTFLTRIHEMREAQR